VAVGLSALTTSERGGVGVTSRLLAHPCQLPRIVAIAVRLPAVVVDSAVNHAGGLGEAVDAVIPTIPIMDAVQVVLLPRQPPTRSTQQSTLRAISTVGLLHLIASIHLTMNRFQSVRIPIRTTSPTKTTSCARQHLYRSARRPHHHAQSFTRSWILRAYYPCSPNRLCFSRLGGDEASSQAA
jgi:hypothetical protein